MLKLLFLVALVLLSAPLLVHSLPIGQFLEKAIKNYKNKQAMTPKEPDAYYYLATCGAHCDSDADCGGLCGTCEEILDDDNTHVCITSPPEEASPDAYYYYYYYYYYYAPVDEKKPGMFIPPIKNPNADRHPDSYYYYYYNTGYYYYGSAYYYSPGSDDNTGDDDGGSDDLCPAIQPILPNDPPYLTCTTDSLCHHVSCDVSLDGYLDFDMDLDLGLCAASGAHVGIGISVPQLGVNWHENFEAGQTYHTPVPGASFDIGFVSVGLYLDIDISGNLSDLDLDISLDACGSVLGITECGSDLLPSVLPIEVFDEDIDLSNICG